MIPSLQTTGVDLFPVPYIRGAVHPLLIPWQPILSRHWMGTVGFVAMIGLLSVCHGQERTVTKLSAKSADGSAVATVIIDTHDAPDLAEWGKEAGMKCLEWLPKLPALLPSEGFVPAKEVTLRFDPAMKGVASTQGATITIAADWVRQHPEDFGMVIHELTHVIQDYRGKGESWLTEGIADYLRYWIYEPGTRTFEIKRVKSHYRQGYGTAAAFLDWIERTQAKGTIVKLNAASREGRYRDSLFEDWFGKSLDVLWEEFVKASELGKLP